MFAYRTTWIVKKGCMQKALELFDVGKPPECSVMRVYTPNISPNVLVFEEDWESKEAHEKFWATYPTSPEGQAALAQFDELVERSTATELWNVAEWR